MCPVAPYGIHVLARAWIAEGRRIGLRGLLARQTRRRSQSLTAALWSASLLRAGSSHSLRQTFLSNLSTVLLEEQERYNQSPSTHSEKLDDSKNFRPLPILNSRMDQTAALWTARLPWAGSLIQNQ